MSIFWLLWQLTERGFCATYQLPLNVNVGVTSSLISLFLKLLFYMHRCSQLEDLQFRVCERLKETQAAGSVKKKFTYHICQVLKARLLFWIFRLSLVGKPLTLLLETPTSTEDLVKFCSFSLGNYNVYVKKNHQHH